MTKVSRFFLSILVVQFFLLFPALGFAQEGEIVQSLSIQGNKRVDDSTVLYYIKTEIGKPLSRQQIRKDIEQIYDLGQFKDIQVDTQSVPGGLNVIFKVVEIASIGDLRIVGNKIIDSEDIQEKIGLRRGAVFHDQQVAESIEMIENLYHAKGYFFVESKIETELTPENLVEVTIHIKEGGKVSVEKIRFSGNKAFADKELRKQMESKEKTWYSWLDESGVYQKDILKLDLFRIEAFYQDRGFVRVSVLEPKIDVNKKDQAIYITIPVVEGVRYKVGSIDIKGDGTFTDEELLGAVQSKKDEWYNVSRLREDVLKISDLYSTQGYAYADVNPVTKIDDDKKTVSLGIEIAKGKKVYVGKINIQGNVSSRDNVLRREFRLREGDLFDSEKLRRTKQRLNNTQFFEDVKIDTGRGEKPDLIDVTTTVTERPTGSISVGAGFSSVEKVIFTGSVSQNNLFGRGQSLVFSTSLSAIRSDFNLAFTEPRIFDTDILGGVDLFNRKTNFFSFSSRSQGGGLRLGKSLTEYDWVGLNYRFENVEVSDVNPGDETAFLKNEIRTTSRIVPSYVRDTRDDFLNPSKGMKHVLRFEFAGGPLGGSDFVKSGYEFTIYRPIIGKLVGAIHAELNYAEDYNGDTLPAFERYFMGGPNSLRGFNIRDVGPKNATGDPIGGTQSLLFNAELQFPFSKSFRGFAFYDRGNVYGNGTNISTTAENINLVEMRHSVGVGLRFLSPFGPVGFAYGFKLDQKDGEDLTAFHFTAGSAF
ncbi:MAG: outer membrane protein assembly factor BamA [Nitrospinae bacterium]|jgi:outer membrane protein insertion porin family|nr:outer membrane protein assembly factor BamA [Nitrospinota bacterium]MDA1110390.1 outer membrane protein assembly factor BamA [Nitrospinota bacterium]